MVTALPEHHFRKGRMNQAPDHQDGETDVAKRRNPSPRNSRRGEAAAATPGPAAGRNGAAEYAAQQVRDALANPGVVEIPERKIDPASVHVSEIGERVLEDADDGGTPVMLDPALIVVPIGRPTQFSWLQLYPDRMLSTPLLPYKPTQDSSPDYHFVAPELEAPLREYLKQVNVHLVWDASGGGSCFLWLILQSTFSPYYLTMQRALALGPEFVATHLFNFGKANLRVKSCPLKQREPRPSDPTVVLPSRPVSQLLPEALGPDHWITSTSHPVYAAVTAGSRV
jgi:hypothetical protein